MVVVEEMGDGEMAEKWTDFLVASMNSQWNRSQIKLVVVRISSHSQTATPCSISQLIVTFGFVQNAISQYFSTIRSLTIRPNTILPQTFR